MVNSTIIKENPFGDYGNIVTDNRFIGRQKEIKKIHNRVLGKDFGNIAVMGLPRIGKSSLVWNALKSHEYDNTIVLYINIGSIQKKNDFYIKIMDKVAREIKTFKQQNLYQELKKIINGFKASSDIGELEYFFRILKDEYKIIYILDEFDNASILFSLSDFQFLREISISPEINLCLVTVSRCTIKEIEAENASISNFYGVFHDLRLMPYDETDIKEYWNWLSQNYITISKEYEKRVDYYVGKHPYLLDLFNYHVFNNINYDKTNISLDDTYCKVEKEIKIDLWNQYDTILTLLETEKLNKSLIQVLIGPYFDIKQNQIEKLIKYGLIKRVENQNSIFYQPISEYFKDYLYQKEIEYQIWPLWSETENSIRKVIDRYLINKYGDNWTVGYVNDFPKQSQKVNLLKEIMKKNIARFGSSASKNILRYTYPDDMWTMFIAQLWSNYFQSILKEKKKDWQEYFSHLAKIRNPIAHSNSDFVLKEDMNKAKMICQKILALLNNINEDL